MTEFAALACMGVVQFALAHYFFFRSIEHISVQEASLISLVEPVLNAVWVALWVGELPSVATFIGGGMILAGLALRFTPLRWGGRAGSSAPPLDPGSSPG